MLQKTIRILIKKLDPIHQGDFKEVYRNSVTIPSDVSFDYSLIEKAFTVLYPGCLIEFQISI